MRRAFAALLAGSLAVALWAPAAGAAPGTGASCAILMDADSRRILYEQNIHQPRQIASITKLMTALVAVEAEPDLGRVVRVQSEWLHKMTQAV